MRRYLVIVAVLLALFAAPAGAPAGGTTARPSPVEGESLAGAIYPGPSDGGVLI